MGTIYYYMRISTEEERGKQKYSRQEQVPLRVTAGATRSNMMSRTATKTIVPANPLIVRAGRS